MDNDVKNELTINPNAVSKTNTTTESEMQPPQERNIKEARGDGLATAAIIAGALEIIVEIYFIIYCNKPTAPGSGMGITVGGLMIIMGVFAGFVFTVSFYLVSLLMYGIDILRGCRSNKRYLIKRKVFALEILAIIMIFVSYLIYPNM